jgi:hypothetical protein
MGVLDLQSTRAAQLDGEIHSRDEAIQRIGRSE